MDSNKTVNHNSRITTEFGDAFLNNNGYYVLKKSNQIYISLHRKVYEKYNGEIPKGWEIHHKDCNKRNNDPSNLVALSSSQHRLLHEELRRKERAKKRAQRKGVK